ncbi:hypothetical protein D0T50_06820 [Bacteroides sp. 214]|uniref:hypothetical protein n=1 Tax=Bacteroides sp. 214 TaxID=2302935 RepID=UPI0013D6C6AA|nr:hypothetical protein [Bacteroides sp. 214]NDW12602.1 hypothetical protein [Bacteroides sp. 214]
MRKLLLIISLCAFVASCSDSYDSSIPNVRINFSCSLLQSPYYKIQTQGMFIPVTKDSHYLPLGYGGLIIGRSIYGDYIAYDAACPVEADRKVSVTVIEDGIGRATCPKCGTRYNLSGGGHPEEGGGTEYLKRYTVSVSGTTLKVTN